MNQILITGEEKVKPKKEKKVLPIKTIVAFYAISIIILGICMISGSVYAKDKINEIVEANAKPSVEIVRNDENNTVEIKVKHIRGIKTITYRWNDEEETVINGNNKKEITETIDLIGGKNTLTVEITEENGQTVKYEKQYTVGNIPEITLEAVSNGVKIIATSQEKLDHISYSWDDGEETTIQVEDGNTTYEGTINAPKGQHTLKIVVVDVNKMQATKTQAVVGDTEPTVNIKHDPINKKIVIDIEDDEEIKTVEITLNGGTKQVINVNDTTYHRELDMIEGVNKLIVTAYNINGLSKTMRVQVDNK